MSDAVKPDIDKVTAIAREAGRAILEVYQAEFSVEEKEDKSPITRADRLSHDIIMRGLQSLQFRCPVLSEEGAQISFRERSKWEYFWLVDPLDGTKEFIKRNGDFTVNIALIHLNEPVLGVVYAPASGELYWGEKGKGAFRNGEQISAGGACALDQKIRAVVSRSHLNAETQSFVDNLRERTAEIDFVSRGSSLKLCMLAEGTADVYPRIAPTMEWDTAAADAVLRSAGGASFIYGGTTMLQYNKENLLNPHFVAVSAAMRRFMFQEESRDE